MIRQATAADADQLFALVEQLGHALEPDRTGFERVLAGYLAGEEPSVVLLVAEEGDRVVGYAIVTIAPLLSTSGPAAQLQEIVVDRGIRGSDLGTQLVRAVEEECVRRGVRQLTVASRRAGGFYDRLGYHENAEYMRRFFD
ncbi:GNAT family N-acetyltransferase [Homoserinibacter sp. YIM 151385]|uniref:GNAT family N-acetyltransferase n=1 Tax=Homoserinibacter sp. YIM 151385 TaxID=2985506 RepID=UPI0022EFE720|nr:GNAT family N-acetyltransferase [Homoserinibacter sp. YIM 151385]WBU38719.1 GNAT family N-acetyltransferase [Homoserinibacter sp. YIM 151385]